MVSIATPPAGPLDEFAVAGPAAKRELWAWAALAVGALAVAGVFALLLALSRTPGIHNVFPWPLGFFDKGLVIHVVFSLVVWFLAVFGGLLQLATLRISGGAPRFAFLGPAAVLCVAVSCPLLFVPAFIDRGEATLNNYVPVIIDPLYYAGLVVLGAGLALATLRLALNLPGSRRKWMSPAAFGAVGGGFAYLVALVCFAIALEALGGESPSHDFNENLFWAGGHVLQFVNVIVMLVAWHILGRIAFPGEAPVNPNIDRVAVGMLAVYAVGGIAFSLKYGFEDDKYFDSITALQYGLGPPVMLVFIAAASWLAGRRGGRPLPWGNPGFLCLVLSALVFFIGGWLGFFVDGADTRTPAHYHGVIAGINLALMGLFLTFFLPLLGRAVARTKAIYAQILLFAGGQTLASIGLFLAGGYGAPRKMAGEAQGLEELGAVAGMYMNGLGALIAVIGGVLFIWTVAAALIRKPAPG